jgi:hypothetical protein
VANSGQRCRWLCVGGADGSLFAAVFNWRLDMESADMTKLDALRILKLLSALESWAYSTKNPLPTFISDDLLTAMAVLEEMVLKEDK